MTVLDIHTYGDKVLRGKALAIKNVTPDLVHFAKDMLETMKDSNGIGLAAPQVGRSIRLIVVDVAGEDEEPKPYVLFNPQIFSTEGETEAEEGCLSVPGIWANVTRPEKISVKALDLKGQAIELKNIDGMLARCIQHEIDHLDGVLFVDKISATEKALNSGKLKKMAKENKVKA